MFENMIANLDMGNVHYVRPGPEHTLCDCGVLNTDTCAYEFVSDHCHIYANGQAILSTHNDQWTASATFIEMMKFQFGDKYSPPLL